MPFSVMRGRFSPPAPVCIKSARADGLYLLLFGAAMFLAISFMIEHLGNGWMEDFKGIYYGTRCLTQHLDPYNPGNVLRLYVSEQRPDPTDAAMGGQRQAISVCVYPPVTFLLTLPLTFLGWQFGHFVWMALIATSFLLAAYLAWNVGAEFSSTVSGALVGFVLANGFGLLLGGNSAGILVNLCAIAGVCFVRQRLAWASVLCLALTLAIKPHDAWLIWLFFLLAGGIYRKRALQTLLVCTLLNVLAILWVSNVAPRWPQELHANLELTAGALGRDNPGPSSLSSHTAGVIVDMQTVFSMFRDEPRFYNAASYLVCGLLFLHWIWITLRTDLTPATTWLALAAIAPLSLLPTYHRTYDAKILLLAIPACAMLWAEGGLMRWLAIAFTGFGIVITGDFPLILLAELTKGYQTGGSLSGKILSVMLIRPIPLVLLAMGGFYLWVYLRRALHTSLAT